jgi:hypothetical protein
MKKLQYVLVSLMTLIMVSGCNDVEERAEALPQPEQQYYDSPNAIPDYVPRDQPVHLVNEWIAEARCSEYTSVEFDELEIEEIDVSPLDGIRKVVSSSYGDFTIVGNYGNCSEENLVDDSPYGMRCDMIGLPNGDWTLGVNHGNNWAPDRWWETGNELFVFSGKRIYSWNSEIGQFEKSGEIPISFLYSPTASHAIGSLMAVNSLNSTSFSGFMTYENGSWRFIQFENNVYGWIESAEASNNFLRLTMRENTVVLYNRETEEFWVE